MSIHPQRAFTLHDEIFIDNFAGGGGASTGIEAALGRPVDHAINHDAIALGMHRINHPQTVHHCEDVFDIDPLTLTEGRRVGGAWFSPDCKHFSKAKGGKPLDKRIRGLVLVILRWAAIRTRCIYMENVEEIQTWGPLLKNGRPNKRHAGRTWRAFLACLGQGIDPKHPDLPEILRVLNNVPPASRRVPPIAPVTREQLVKGFGYDVQTRELRACDYGTPTIRKRLILMARCDGQPIVWPDPTHCDPNLKSEIANLKSAQPWRAVAECIDWHLPCPSIFLTSAQAKRLKCKRPLARATLRRIATGLGRYVIHADEPFIIDLTHQGGERLQPVSQPIRTLTGANRGEKALVAPTMIQRSHYKSNSKMSKRITEPMRSQSTAQEHAVVEGKLAPLITEHANASTPRSMPADGPLRTQCANVKGGHFALFAASTVEIGYGERAGQKPRARDIRKPAGTAVGARKHALVAASLVTNTTGHSGSELNAPVPTLATGGHHALVAAHAVKLRGTNVGHPSDEPLHTASAGGQHHALSCAYLAQHNAGFNTNPGHPVTEPVSTLNATGSQQQLVSATLAAYYGSEADGQAVTESMRSTTAKPRFCMAQTRLARRYPGLTAEQLAGAARVARFLRSFGIAFEGEFATVAGHVIIDIGMRMLTPRELFRAQGFANTYVIDRAWVADPKTGEVRCIALTKEQQIRLCGNSVCPPLAEAIIKANQPELCGRIPVLKSQLSVPVRKDLKSMRA